MWLVPEQLGHQEPVPESEQLGHQVPEPEQLGHQVPVPVPDHTGMSAMTVRATTVMLTPHLLFSRTKL